MNKKEKYILLGLFLFAIVLVNSYLSMTMDTKETEKSKDIKENFTGLINDVYKDFNVTTNKAFRQLRNSFRNNKETFQRSYRSFTRPVNKL